LSEREKKGRKINQKRGKSATRAPEGPSPVLGEVKTTPPAKKRLSVPRKKKRILRRREKKSLWGEERESQ